MSISCISSSGRLLCSSHCSLGCTWFVVIHEILVSIFVRSYLDLTTLGDFEGFQYMDIRFGWRRVNMRFFGACVLLKYTHVQRLVWGGVIARRSFYRRCRSKKTWRWIRWSPCNVHYLDVIFIWITKDHIIYLQFNLAKRMSLQCSCDGLIFWQHYGWIHLQFRRSIPLNEPTPNDKK